MTPAADAPATLFVTTVPLRDGNDPLVRRLPPKAPLAWLRGDDGLIAWGRAAVLRPGVRPPGGDPTDTHRFREAAAWMGSLAEQAEVDDRVCLPGTGLVAFGGFAFDPASDGSSLTVPRVVVGRRGGTTWLTTVSDAPGTHPEELVWPSPGPRPVGPVAWSTGSLSAQDWSGAVADAIARIRGGGLDKVVLARDAFAEAGAPIDVRTLLERLRRDYPDCYAFSVGGMVGATPELLLRRTGADLTSLVLAGTRPRGASPEEDERLGADLAASDKDREEHAYAVDSLRRALDPLCTRIEAPGEPRLLRLANVQHLATPARAALRPGVSTLEAVAALHPTAAVGGTPTAAAMRLIREIEGMDRGAYAGPVGWLDGAGNAEWGIALRCALVAGPRARLFAGCGIVAGSEPRAELAEADSKFRVMRAALTD